MSNISVLSLISYDYELLLESLPTYIDLVDEVILGLDSNRLTWANKKFELPHSFFASLKAIDKANKVKIVEEEFYLVETKTTDMTCRERNILSSHAAEGNWLLSIDADEFLLNIDELISFLHNYDDQSVLIYANWITLFKQDDKNAFIIDGDYESIERFPLATKLRNSFTMNRATEQTVVFSPICALHKSWARTEDQLQKKLANFGGFSIEEFLERWKSLNESNYKEWINFHPLNPPSWPRLSMVKLNEVDAFAAQKSRQNYSQLAWQNIPLKARLKLFEDKIIARDAKAQEVHTEHEKTVLELKQTYERKLAEQVRAMKDLKLQLDAELFASRARRQNEQVETAKKSADVEKRRGIGGLFKNKE